MENKQKITNPIRNLLLTKETRQPTPTLGSTLSPPPECLSPKYSGSSGFCEDACENPCGLCTDPPVTRSICTLGNPIDSLRCEQKRDISCTCFNYDGSGETGPSGSTVITTFSQVDDLKNPKPNVTSFLYTMYPRGVPSADSCFTVPNPEVNDYSYLSKVSDIWQSTPLSAKWNTNTYPDIDRQATTLSNSQIYPNYIIPGAYIYFRQSNKWPYEWFVDQWTSGGPPTSCMCKEPKKIEDGDTGSLCMNSNKFPQYYYDTTDTEYMSFYMSYDSSSINLFFSDGSIKSLAWPLVNKVQTLDPISLGSYNMTITVPINDGDMDQAPSPITWKFESAT
jgi:hypothetical protein